MELFKDFSKQLTELVEAAGKSLPEFEGREFSGLSDLELPLVEASIRLRTEGSHELSLELLESAVAFGLRSGLIDDNRAWALVGLGRLPEAVALWRQLEALTDQDELAAIARERLDIYAIKAYRLVEMNKAHLLIKEGQIDESKTVLLRAMLDDPSWDGYAKTLIRLLKKERGHLDDTDVLRREYQEEQLNLEVFDLYLDFVEQRLKDDAVSLDS